MFRKKVYFGRPREKGKMMDEPVFDLSKPEKSYTPAEAAEWLGKSDRWVRQKASELKIGQKHRKLWTFVGNDLTILYTQIKRRKKVEEPTSMRDVSPRSAEEAARVQSAADDAKDFLRNHLESLKREFFDLANEILRAAHNEIVKETNRHEKMIHKDYLTLVEVKHDLEAIKEFLRDHGGKFEVGRGALVFGDAAPLSPMTTGRPPLEEAA